MKKVLVLCTGNSCRSIIAEALLNSEGIKAYSSGVNPSLKVNPLAKKVLEENGIWSDEYHSKTLDEVIEAKPTPVVLDMWSEVKEFSHYTTLGKSKCVR